MRAGAVVECEADVVELVELAGAGSNSPAASQAALLALSVPTRPSAGPHGRLSSDLVRLSLRL